MDAFEGLSGSSLVLLLVCLAIAFGFEFVNGFHDTANAVATVIYTQSLKPRVAVVISGLCNFTGVFLGGIGVALGIMKLLPVELLVSSGAGAGLAMVLALLLSAIVWNLGTWYFGLPASSSHTLVGAIIGVGLANSMLPGRRLGDGVNWAKAEEVGLSLLVSPIVGFAGAALLLLAMRAVFRTYEALFQPPPKGATPPLAIRALLTLTCGGVSFGHGMNDGQKGVGIVMLILMGLVPAGYALDRTARAEAIDRTIAAAATLDRTVQDRVDRGAAIEAEKAREQLAQVRARLSGKGKVVDIPREQRFEVRQAILLADKSIDTLVKARKLALDGEQTARLAADRKALRALTDYAPSWVLMAVALSLGIGTMIGWKRIVVTVGEKIGKTHLTYAQGASAEMMAASTIVLASNLGLPVSTTHVLSSGIAGTMVAQRSGLHSHTVRNIAIAWLLTLPVSMVLSGLLFLGFRVALASPHEQVRPVVVVPGNDERPPPAPRELTLRLGGSSTIGQQLAPALAKRFLERQGAEGVGLDEADAKAHRVVVRGMLAGKPIRVEIDAPASKVAFECLASGACDLGMSSRPIHEGEIAKLKRLGDMTRPSCEHVLGQDGVAVIVGPDSPLSTVSQADLARIFTGAITDWSAIGGPAGPIKVLARDPASGTYDVFAALVTQGAELKAATSFGDSAALSRAVSGDPAAIGFVGLPHVGGAKALAVRDGAALPIYPTVFTVATESYPLTRRLYLYSESAPRNPLASAFIGFAQSDEGQRLVEAAGFVSLAVRAEVPKPVAGAPERYAKQSAGAARLSVDFRFREGDVELDTKGVRDLDRVVAYLSRPENRAQKPLLFGFADGVGQERQNEALSRQRAEAVAKLFAQRGVVASAIDGFGSALPVGSRSTPEGRARNQRVEVWVR